MPDRTAKSSDQYGRSLRKALRRSPIRDGGRAVLVILGAIRLIVTCTQQIRLSQRQRTISILILSLILSHAARAGAAPSTLNYQGKLLLNGASSTGAAF